jgi:hypothetical protein
LNSDGELGNSCTQSAFAVVVNDTVLQQKKIFKITAGAYTLFKIYNVLTMFKIF